MSFVTTKTSMGQALLHSERNATLLIDVLRRRNFPLASPIWQNERRQGLKPANSRHRRGTAKDRALIQTMAAGGSQSRTHPENVQTPASVVAATQGWGSVVFMLGNENFLSCPRLDGGCSMSKRNHQVSDRQMAANHSNAQKSTGPKTLRGKARVALNAIKHGAYVKADNVRRQLMAQRGEDPAEYEQLHQDLIDSCQPEDALQAMAVKTIGDKTWDKLKLRRTLLEWQLGSAQLSQARFQRQLLAGRRWPGVRPGTNRGLCGTKDSPEKFIDILQCLERLQGWFEKETCPDEYPEVMEKLYGEFPTPAGLKIREWFMQFFADDQAQCQEARQELPKWIAREKSDVEPDRELYRRELALRNCEGASTTEDEVAAKETALERQIAEQTRLLLQLKSKRSLWGEGSAAEEAEASEGGLRAHAETTRERTSLEAGTQGGPNGTAHEAKHEKRGQNAQTKP
jgi:hypothetical protein